MRQRLFVLPIIALSVIFLTACNRNKLPDDAYTSPTPTSALAAENPTATPTPAQQYDYSAALTDVSGGTASGTAFSSMIDGKYELYATFEGLSGIDRQKYFYDEGWVVRSSPLSIISTGALQFTDGRWSNSFTSDTDLTDHP